MSELDITWNLFVKAVNRLRVRLFGSDSLKIFRITPETGETETANLATDWCGRRTESTTSSGDNESGAWQFKVIAAADWQTSQAFMSAAVSFKIGERRWKVKKIEKPVGNSRVWKVKAEIQ